MDRTRTLFTPDRLTRLAGAHSLLGRRPLAAVLLLATALTFSPSLTPDADATGCYLVSGRVRINGGVARTRTVIDPEANGGVALSNAVGGDDNVAIGVLGDANAGKGGSADASANGGSIEVGDVNSGQNTGNVIDVGN